MHPMRNLVYRTVASQYASALHFAKGKSPFCACSNGRTVRKGPEPRISALDNASLVSFRWLCQQPSSQRSSLAQIHPLSNKNTLVRAQNHCASQITYSVTHLHYRHEPALNALHCHSLDLRAGFTSVVHES